MTDLGSVPVVFKTGIKIRNAIYDYDDTSDNYRYEYIGSLTNEELLRSVQSPSELSYGDTGATVSTITGSDIFICRTLTNSGRCSPTIPGTGKMCRRRRSGTTPISTISGTSRKRPVRRM